MSALWQPLVYTLAIFGATGIIVGLVVAAVFTFWPVSDRKQWRILRAQVGTPWILERRSHYPMGSGTYWGKVGEFETEGEALVAMRETILRENPQLHTEFDGKGRQAA